MMTLNVKNANVDIAEKGMKRIDVKVNDWVVRCLVENAKDAGMSVRSYIRKTLEKAAKRPRRFKMFGFFIPAGGENDTM